MYFGWHDDKFVCLVQDSPGSGKVIVRISMKLDEAKAVADSILHDGRMNCERIYEDHEQIV